MITCNLILSIVTVISCFIIDTNHFNSSDSGTSIIGNSNNNDPLDNALIQQLNQITIPNSLKIKLNKRNIQSNDLFNLILKRNHSFKSFFYNEIAQGIMAWLTDMERIMNNDHEFEEIMNTIRPFVQIIQKKIFNLTELFPSGIEYIEKNVFIFKLLILFDYSNDFINSFIKKFLYSPFNESFKLMESKDNPCNYDLDRIQVISTFIAPYNQKRVAIDISKIIGEYDQDESLKYFHGKIIGNLKLIENEKSRLDFYDKNFMRNLIPFIENVSISNNDSFWHNLKRLAFKWMIHKREASINIMDGENSFEESLKDIKLVASIIESKIDTSIPINFNLESMTDHTLIRFESLIKCEFIENGHIFHSFADAIKDFHENMNNQRMNNEAACQLLKFNHFNGHFDSNIRLKYLILFHAPIKGMKDCILMDDPKSNYFPFYHPKIFNERVLRIEEYLNNSNLIKGPESLELNFVYDEDYLSRSALKFLQSNNQKFRVKSSLDIFHILRMLYEAELLTWNMIKSLVEFELNDESLGWSWEKFNEAIRRLKEDFKKSFKLEEYLEKLDSSFTF